MSVIAPEYEARKEAARARNAGISASGRDIGDIPPVVSPERRKIAESSFRIFCETYFPATFYLEWSDDHLKVIAKLEEAVLHGGLFAMAMPRGSGKSSLCEVACLWSILGGSRRFPCLIGSDEGSAEQNLQSIKSELANNEMLADDFPEVCFPIVQLEGISNRCAGQTCNGVRTQIGWTANEIILPTIAGSKASGAIIRVAGITGRIRGMKYKRADGPTVRPDLVLLDDPQTDESARSPSQCKTREETLAGAILGLAGPGKKIAGLMTLTVVRPGDMADRILDRGKHPQWQGQRMKMIYAFPKNEAKWDEYAKLRDECLRAESGTQKLSDFYVDNRAELEDGAVVAWRHRKNPDEMSALQHAMNLKFNNEAAFFAEFQNEPLSDDEFADDLPTADDIAKKTNGIKRGEVPQGCNHVTAFIDLQQDVLFWAVCAWEDEFKAGYVIDYGAFPEQTANYYTLREVKLKLSQVSPGTGVEGSLYAGLEKLTANLLGKDWKRDDGAVMRISKCLIDSGWMSDVVHQFCRQTSHAAVVTPSKGVFVGASSLPFDSYKKRIGDRVGHNWRIPSVAGRRVTRHVIFDTNYWKSFLQSRLAVAMGDKTCLSMFAGHDHRMLADHLTAESRVQTEGRGRKLHEWRLRKAGRDNHLLDCLVGCAVAASMQGVSLAESATYAAKSVQRIKLSDIQKQKRSKQHA